MDLIPHPPPPPPQLLRPKVAQVAEFIFSFLPGIGDEPYCKESVVQDRTFDMLSSRSLKALVSRRFFHRGILQALETLSRAPCESLCQVSFKHLPYNGFSRKNGFSSYPRALVFDIKYCQFNPL